jgi:hypothetical protein
MTSFVIPLLLSSKAFLARMLDSDKAEIFGSLDSGIFIFTAGFGIEGPVIVSGSFSILDSITGIVS